MNTFGAIQAGVFYKSLYDPIINTSHEVTNFTPPPPYNNQTGDYIISQPLNAGSAHLFGFEIAYLQHFSFAPGIPQRDLAFRQTTGTRFRVPAESRDVLDHPHLLRQAPNTWNISPTYDRGRFSYRLGVSYNDANIFSYQYQDGTAGRAQRS